MTTKNQRTAGPLERLKHHVTGAIKRGEKTAIVGQSYAPENPLAMDLNLDAMPLSELEKFAQECGACGCSAQMAKKLFPAKQRGYRKAANLLSNYAWNKLTAMKLRLDGEINRAIEYESICDRIYDRMPDWAKGW